MTERAWPPTTAVTWDKTFRLVPSRYPPIDLFERIADPADWEILAAIEGLTNDRLRDEVGDVSLVPVNERLAGPGASPIMAAFTHIGFPSRFTDGRYGVYYASDRLPGAIREVVHHQQIFLSRTREPATRLEMRIYQGALFATMHDVRGGWPDVHNPHSYTAGQNLARSLRQSGSNGIVYDSVRLMGASNVAVFRPHALASPSGRAHVTAAGHLIFDWNGARIVRFIRVGEGAWSKVDELTA